MMHGNIFIQMVPDSCCVQDDVIPSSPIDVNKCNSDVINGTIANSEYVFEEVSSNVATKLYLRSSEGQHQ